MKKISVFVLVVSVLFFMMSCEKNKENEVLLSALKSAGTSEQIGFRISYDIYLNGENPIEHSYDSYWFDHPFYVHYSATADSDMSQMLIKRDETYYFINEADHAYYQSSAPETLESNVSSSMFELIEDAKLTSSSVYFTYETQVLASKLNESMHMMDALKSYVGIYYLDESTEDLDDIKVDVTIKVRKKGEIHSIVFDVSQYLNNAYELSEGKVFERALIEYYYLPAPFIPDFDEETPYLIDDHANAFEHRPVLVSLNGSFSMHLQYMFDIDIVTFEITERKDVTFSKTGSPTQASVYNEAYLTLGTLYGTTTITLDPGTYYIVAIGIHDLGVINISISS